MLRMFQPNMPSVQLIRHTYVAAIDKDGLQTLKAHEQSH